MRTLHEDLRKFIYCWILLEWEMFQTKAVERINTHIMFKKNVSQIHAVFEIMWRNMLQPDRAQVAIITVMRFVWWVQATDKLSEYVILIALRRNSGYANASRCCVVRTLLILLISEVQCGWPWQYHIGSEKHYCPFLGLWMHVTICYMKLYRTKFLWFFPSIAMHNCSAWTPLSVTLYAVSYLLILRPL
jgi:hypothetical protein